LVGKVERTARNAIDHTGNNWMNKGSGRMSKMKK